MNMKDMLLCALAVLLVAYCVDATEYGYARITGGTADPGIVGDIYFVTLNSSFVGVYASISGITQRLDSLHGMHVHTWGDINDPTGVAAGPHYVGRGASQHGCYPNNREEGDMGNWNVSATGTVNQYKELDILALTSTYSIIGRSVIFHLNEDDCVNMTSSATRLARGVIGVGNPAYYPSNVFPAFTDTNTAYNAGSQSVTGKAVCYLVGTDGNSGITGTVLFEDMTGGVLVTATISGLTLNSQHGFHVHNYGDLTLSNGTSIGDHFNPLNSAHGVPPNATRHVGDMGNVCNYDANGVAYYQYLNTLLTIGSTTVATNVLGRAVALHATLDTGDTTSYGARIAQCVIGIANNSTQRPTSTVTDSDVSCGVVPVTTTPAPVSTTTTASTTSSTSAATSAIASGMLFVFAMLALML